MLGRPVGRDTKSWMSRQHQRLTPRPRVPLFVHATVLGLLGATSCGDDGEGTTQTVTTADDGLDDHPTACHDGGCTFGTTVTDDTGTSDTGTSGTATEGGTAASTGTATGTGAEATGTGTEATGTGTGATSTGAG